MRDWIKKSLLLSYLAIFSSGIERRDNNLPFGINLIGYIRGDFGLGESCRLVAGALEAAAIPFSIRNISQNGSAGESNLKWAYREKDDIPYAVNLIHLNPPDLPNALWNLNPYAMRSRYNIGFWLWEQTELPAEWDSAFRLVDEIWTPTEFVSKAVRRSTDKPVCTMPYGLQVPEIKPGCGRAFFGLPEGRFLFLVSYDGNSVTSRKNPEGAIRAYRKAFPSGSGQVGLVVKATNETPERLDRLRMLLEDCQGFTILTENYSKEVFNSLIANVDAYVSLHRAEGFGLVMAEAMLLGIPVIATDWSGNTEFMNSEVACMVNAKLVELEEDWPPFRKGSRWAQPDEDQAAMWMRKLYEDETFREGLVQRASAYLEEGFSVWRAAESIKMRLEELKNEWGS